MNLKTYSLYGGYNYTSLIDIKASCLEDAAAEWYDRWASNGNRKVDGVYWPCFGDMAEDDYAVIDYDTEDTMTRGEILAKFD